MLGQSWRRQRTGLGLGTSGFVVPEAPTLEATRALMRISLVFFLLDGNSLRPTFTSSAGTLIWSCQISSPQNNMDHQLPFRSYAPRSASKVLSCKMTL